MDFSAILDEWDRRNGPAGGDAGTGRDRYAGGDSESENEKTAAANRRRRLLRKVPDAELDLHGFSRQNAWTALENFFRAAKEQGLEKLQIIHGKGNHEGSGGALKDMTREFIEECPFAGESGYSFGNSGGSGATWVLLKKTNARGR